MSSDLDVRLVRRKAGDEAGSAAAIEVVATNREAHPVRLIDCVVFLPMGIRLSSDAPRLTYPHELPARGRCVERFECDALAARVRQDGYTGHITLDAAFLEDGGLDESAMAPTTRRMTRGREHRTGPFAFDAGDRPR